MNGIPTGRYTTGVETRTSTVGGAALPGHAALGGATVVVTGASSGLGARFVQTLVAHGAQVVATARRGDRLQQLTDEFGTARVLAVPGDIAEPEFPAHLLSETLARFGRIDVLVNNAGTQTEGPSSELSAAEFARVVNVNLTSVFNCCREAYRPMRDAGGGSIINVASVLGMLGLGVGGQSAYSASKGGVISLTRALAAEWAPDGVRVNALAPGWFPSEMTADIFAADRQLANLERRTPMRRTGTEDELDGALTFLAGAGSSFVTGHVLTVDGGFSVI
jgi:NAD(P)-dependent dehydrogenase (short-subunit alcohol dehydrogenase family)